MRLLRPLRAMLALLLAAALLPAVVAPSPAVAASSAACPGDEVPATGFGDTRTSVHRVAIDCAAWWGLVAGTSETTFVPAGDVTRGQTAAMVARMLRSTGVAPSEVPSAGFTDTDGNVFEEDIDLLASLGIVSGASDTTFEPEAPVTRAQMASIISQTFELAYEDPLPDEPVLFIDV
ncbi:MAG: S-layer homology domain-containing protein, partial [Nitriliruptoraceae bacterium]